MLVQLSVEQLAEVHACAVHASLGRIMCMLDQPSSLHSTAAAFDYLITLAPQTGYSAASMHLRCGTIHHSKCHTEPLPAELPSRQTASDIQQSPCEQAPAS